MWKILENTLMLVNNKYINTQSVQKVPALIFFAKEKEKVFRKKFSIIFQHKSLLVL